MSADLTGHINCSEQCEIPEGVTLREMPPSRHAWSDMVRCPDEDCERQFMITARPSGPVETCGETTVFWPDDECCDAVCCLPKGHQPVDRHHDETLGEWGPE